MTTSQSLSVSFSNEESSTEISTELELDDDRHLALYGTEKSTFSKTESVYLKIKPIYSEEPYTIQTSKGTCCRVSQNNIEEVEEYLTFQNTVSSSLSYTPIGPVTTLWTSGNGGLILKNGKMISIPSPALAILKCTYNIYFDRLKLTVPSTMEDTEVLVMAGSDLYGYDNLSVSYYDEDSEECEGVITDITLTIKDIMTDSIIEGATVVISKSGVTLYTGTSNSSGQVVLKGICATGETYDVKTTATNYFGSDEDYLNNDSFTVPVE